MFRQCCTGIIGAVVLFFLACSNTVHAGSTSYLVNVNTSSLNGVSGYLDFQFNPGGSGVAAATATISGFSTDGTLQPSAPFNSVSGNVSGALPGILTLQNSTAFNDYFEGFQYGSVISLGLTLSGPAVGSSQAIGSSFALSLYDDSGTEPLLTTDPNGSVLTVNVDPDGAISVLTFPQSSTDNTPAVSANAVPEPSSMTLAFLLAPGVLLSWRQLRRTQVAPARPCN